MAGNAVGRKTRPERMRLHVRWRPMVVRNGLQYITGIERADACRIDEEPALARTLESKTELPILVVEETAEAVSDARRFRETDMHGIVEVDHAVVVNIAVADVAGTVVAVLHGRIVHLRLVAEQTLVDKAHLLGKLMPDFTLPCRSVVCLVQFQIRCFAVSERTIQDHPKIRGKGMLDFAGEVNAPAACLANVVQLVILHTDMCRDGHPVREDVVAHLLVSVQRKLKNTFEQLSESTQESINELRNTSVTELNALNEYFEEQRKELKKILQAQQEALTTQPDANDTLIQELHLSTEKQEKAMDKLQNTFKETGEKIAQSIVSYFANPLNRNLVERLKEAGLRFSRSEEDLSGYTDKLAGQSIVISGVFEHHSRDEYKEMIERNGGKNVGSISSKTSFILAGANMGPAKLEKAQKLGIRIMSENEFLDLLS